MKQYEIAVVFDPQLEIDLSKPTAKVEKLLTDNDGKIIKTDNWGKKKLAYPIAGQEHGVYVFYTVELPARNVSKIEAALNITDEIIRYLIVKLDLKAMAKAEAAKAEKAKKAAARADRNESGEETD